MKTQVRVTLVARQEVDIVVEHEVDEDPTDLTEDDQVYALGWADHGGDWEIEDVQALRELEEDE